MVKSKRQGLTIPEFLYNMAKYYESNAVFYEHARNIVLSLLIPLYLALLALESIVNLSSGMYLFVMILIVIISLSIYYYYLKREKYYLFYLDIVKEYIQKSRYGLSFIKW